MRLLDLIATLEALSFKFAYRTLEKEGWCFRDGDHTEGYLVMGKGVERLRVVREEFFGTQVTYSKVVS
jgi:hypothetical protein